METIGEEEEEPKDTAVVAPGEAGRVDSYMPCEGVTITFLPLGCIQDLGKKS